MDAVDLLLLSTLGFHLHLAGRLLPFLLVVVSPNHTPLRNTDIDCEWLWLALP